MKTALSFEATKQERAAILEVAKRTEDVIKKRGLPVDYDRMTIVMDLTATNANGCPLDFDKLMAFPEFDFCHDVFGIRRHIDRETGELTDYFVPRCAK